MGSPASPSTRHLVHGALARGAVALLRPRRPELGGGGRDSPGSGGPLALRLCRRLPNWVWVRGSPPPRASLPPSTPPAWGPGEPSLPTPCRITRRPITWLILSEVFPIRVRAAAVSVGSLLNFGSNYLVGTVFELSRAKVGEPALFATFATIAALSVAFVFAKVPETRGLSLEEIEAKIEAGW